MTPLQRVLRFARNTLMLWVLDWEGDPKKFRKLPPVHRVAPEETVAPPARDWGELPVPRCFADCIAPPEGTEIMAQSNRVLVMPDLEVLLSYHGFNRLITEELIGKPCFACEDPRLAEGSLLYHPLAYPGVPAEDMEDAIVALLAEPLH